MSGNDAVPLLFFGDHDRNHPMVGERQQTPRAAGPKGRLAGRPWETRRSSRYALGRSGSSITPEAVVRGCRLTMRRLEPVPVRPARTAFCEPLAQDLLGR